MFDLFNMILSSSTIGGSSVGGKVSYSDIVYNNDNTITLIDVEGIEHIVECVYEGNKLVLFLYDGKPINIGYNGADLDNIGKTNINLTVLLSPLANTVYEAYDVNRKDYPYLLISGNTFNYKYDIQFATDISITDSEIVMQGNTLSGGGSGSSQLPFNKNDSEATTQYLVKHKITLTEGTTALNNKKNSSQSFHINFDKDVFTGSIYNI